MAEDRTTPLATKLTTTLRERGLKITTAESCTGGLVAASITYAPGASSVFDAGIVTYANHMKTKLLGVSEDALKKYGAVSEEVARQMVEGICKESKADIGLSTTGIAGPTGGTAQKPVGLVYIGISTKNGTKVKRHMFKGDRQEVRAQATYEALALALSELDNL